MKKDIKKEILKEFKENFGSKFGKSLLYVEPKKIENFISEKIDKILALFEEEKKRRAGEKICRHNKKLMEASNGPVSCEAIYFCRKCYCWVYKNGKRV